MINCTTENCANCHCPTKNHISDQFGFCLNCTCPKYVAEEVTNRPLVEFAPKIKGPYVGLMSRECPRCHKVKLNKEFRGKPLYKSGIPEHFYSCNGCRAEISRLNAELASKLTLLKDSSDEVEDDYELTEEEEYKMRVFDEVLSELDG